MSLSKSQRSLEISDAPKTLESSRANSLAAEKSNPIEISRRRLSLYAMRNNVWSLEDFTQLTRMAGQPRQRWSTSNGAKKFRADEHISRPLLTALAPIFDSNGTPAALCHGVVCGSVAYPTS